MDTILPAKPSSYKQLIKLSFLLYGMSVGKVLLLSLGLALVVFFPRLLSNALQQNIFAVLSSFHVYRIFLLVLNILSLFLFISILWRVHCVIRHKHEPLSEDISRGLKKVFYGFIAAIIQSLIILCALSLIIGLQVLLNYYNLLFSTHPLGIVVVTALFMGELFLILYVSFLFIFFIPLITIENKGILTSLEKSMFLVWNHWWRVFSVQVTPWVCYTLLFSIIRICLPSLFSAYFLQSSIGMWGLILLNIILFAIFIPWVAALLLIQLKDLELRKKLAAINETGK